MRTVRRSCVSTTTTFTTTTTTTTSQAAISQRREAHVFYWQRPLGADDSVRRLTVSTTTASARSWASPYSWNKLRDEIRRCSGVTKIQTLEVVGSNLLTKNQCTLTLWETLCRDLRDCLRDVRAIHCMAECSDADCAILLNHMLKPQSDATVANANNNTNNDPRRIWSVSIQSGGGGDGGFGGDDSSGCTHCKPGVHENKLGPESRGNYTETLRALSVGCCTCHDTARNVVPQLQYLDLSCGAAFQRTDTLYLLHYILPRVQNRVRLRGIHFADLSSYVELLHSLEYESTGAVVTLVDCTIPNELVLSQQQRVQLLAREEFVNWNAALQTLRLVVLERHVPKRRPFLPRGRSFPSHHTSDIATVVDTAVTVLRDWYRSSSVALVPSERPSVHVTDTITDYHGRCTNATTPPSNKVTTDIQV